MSVNNAPKDPHVPETNKVKVEGKHRDITKVHFNASPLD